MGAQLGMTSTWLVSRPHVSYSRTKASSIATTRRADCHDVALEPGEESRPAAARPGAAARRTLGSRRSSSLGEREAVDVLVPQHVRLSPLRRAHRENRCSANSQTLQAMTRSGSESSSWSIHAEAKLRSNLSRPTGEYFSNGCGVSMARNESVSGSPGRRSSAPFPLVYCGDQRVLHDQSTCGERAGELGLERVAREVVDLDAVRGLSHAPSAGRRSTRRSAPALPSARSRAPSRTSGGTGCCRCFGRGRPAGRPGCSCARP